MIPPFQLSDGFLPRTVFFPGVLAIVLLAAAPPAQALVPADESAEEITAEVTTTPAVAREPWKKLWSTRLTGAVGLTAGDWNSDGEPEVLVATAPGVFTAGTPQVRVFSADMGDLLTTFPAPGLTRKEPARLKVGSLASDKPVLALTTRTWAQHVSVLTTGGKELWRYPAGLSPGVDDMAWVDTDGDKKMELLVGFNGFMGLHLVSGEGQKKWENTKAGNFWNVGGLPMGATRSAVLLAAWTGGLVVELDTTGKAMAIVTPPTRTISTFSADVVDKTGRRELVAVTEPDVISPEPEALCIDLDGRIVWKRKMEWQPTWSQAPPSQAADIDSDGRKEWFLQTGLNRIEAINGEGETLAGSEWDNQPLLWTVAEDNGDSVLVVYDGKALSGYEVAKKR